MTTPIPDRPIPLSDLVADDKIVALHNEQLAGEPEDKAAHDLAIPASAYAADNKVQTVRRFWKACMYAFMAACGAMFDGYAISIPGSIIANPGFVQVFATLEIGGVPTLDPTYVGVWTGMTSAGQLIGMLGGPFACDRFGRRFGMVLLTVMLLIGIILEIVSKDWKVFLAARIFAGIGTGLVQSGITVYISEIAPPQIRGSLLSMYSLMFGVGQLAASIGLKVVADMAPSQFRHAFYSQFALLAIFVPMIYFIPESPWFYMRRYDEEKAKRSMVRLYGNAEGYDMETEIEVLRQNIQAFEILQQAQSRSAVFDLFKGVNGQVGLRRRTFISAFPLIFQQFLGIPLIFGYSTYFFSLAGLTDPFLGSLIVTLIFLTFILVSFFTVEAVGRRKSLMVGGAVMGICTLVIGILGTVSSSLNGAALIALCAVWVMAYALSAGPLGWTFVGETSTPRLRAKTAGVAAGSSSCVGIIFAFTVPKMLANPGANWGLKIGYLFSGLTVVGLIVIYLTIPETRARTYSELDELFERRIPANRFATTKTQVDVARDEVTGAVA